MSELGVGAIRWPGGVLVDTLDWTTSVGPIESRGETLGLGARQTPSLGLNEFLDLCDQLQATPMVQLNLLGPTSDLADLVEYCNGDGLTVQGALRISHGYISPWSVVEWELGSEPTGTYQGAGVPGDTGANYAQTLVPPAIAAVQGADPSARLGGLAHTQFLQADWIGLVPFLDLWNGHVFSGPMSITGDVDFVTGGYFSYQGNHPDPQERFVHLMSAGTTLRRCLARLDARTGGLPFRLNSHNAYVFGPTVEEERSRDFQAGLVVADQLMAAIDLELEAAYVFDLADPVLGLLRDPGTWTSRPTAVTFQMLSALAGEPRLEARVTRTPKVVASGGEGSVKSDTRYGLIDAVATRRSSGLPRVVLINRSFDRALRVRISVTGAAPSRYRVTRYASPDLEANNETVPGTVATTTETWGNARGCNHLMLRIPAHTLLRIDYE